VDIPANRYDILCIEGLCRAINIFNNKTPDKYTLEGSPVEKERHHKLQNFWFQKGFYTKILWFLKKIIVEESTAAVRPIVMGAVLRNVTFTESSYESFIDLQDKLHQNLARQRTLSSIGTHDLGFIRFQVIFF